MDGMTYSPVSISSILGLSTKVASVTFSPESNKFVAFAYDALPNVAFSSIGLPSVTINPINVLNIGPDITNVFTSRYLSAADTLVAAAGLYISPFFVFSPNSFLRKTLQFLSGMQLELRFCKRIIFILVYLVVYFLR